MALSAQHTQVGRGLAVLSLPFIRPVRVWREAGDVERVYLACRNRLYDPVKGPDLRKPGPRW